ncbi:Sugar phosphotransferase [Balamuthia mandrillaris]
MIRHSTRSPFGWMTNMVFVGRMFVVLSLVGSVMMFFAIWNLDSHERSNTLVADVQKSELQMRDKMEEMFHKMEDLSAQLETIKKGMTNNLFHYFNENEWPDLWGTTPRPHSFDKEPTAGSTIPYWLREEIRNTPIVYTFVNGSIPEYREQRKKYCPISPPERCVGGGRDRTNDELRYSLRSLQKNIPWHKGHIYIVAPKDHHPYWLNVSHPRIHMVDQEDLFPDDIREHLPTFSSTAIEPHLWRAVPEGTRNFIYINDDCFIGQPMRPVDFFTSTGQGNVLYLEPSVVHATQKKWEEWNEKHQKIWLAGVYKSILRIKERFPDTPGQPTTYHFLKHAPFVINREALKNISTIWHEDFKTTAAHRFRHTDDVFAVWMHTYYVYHTFPKSQFRVWNVENGKTAMKLFKATAKVEEFQQTIEWIRENKPIIYTINDSGYGKPVAELFSEFMEAEFPQPSIFERRDQLPTTTSPRK